ncbi:MAG: undecaprenyl/decaprenyl-phosphate alpha-N-acetylglucosaminyl 1-phosphate transferase [Chloroflexi bacterium]|nr:undecaprenyl/decaprenyl-phosphate alpha-N-acetylglucosaminyl 1-phosphate transferase [Chloroflexota bacterium]
MTLEAWYAAVGLAAFVFAVPAVRAAERIAWKVHLVDVPRAGEIQERPLPRTGGYGLCVAFWLAIGLSFLIVPESLQRLAADNRRLLGLFIGSLVLIPLSALDDYKRLSPLPQLVGHVLVASIPVFFGLRVEELATPFGVVAIPDPIQGPFAVVWVVGMMNAINLIDSMDGLSSGIAAIAAIVLFLRSAWFGQASIAVLPIALAGASLGFLTRNWHPAKVILGSGGSLFLGYVLGATTVIGGAKIGTAFLVLAVPILDIAWVIYQRLAAGRSPFQGGDSAHLAHRLRLLGVSVPAAVVGLYGVTATVGAAVLLTHSVLPTLGKLYLAGGVVAGISGLLLVVAKLSARRLETPPNAQPRSE